MATPFPTSPDEIDDDWLSHALNVPVRSHRIVPITDRSGVNGETHRVFMETDAGPSSVVAKFPHLPSRGVAEFQRWYEREVRFYRELAAESPLRTPRCFSAEIAANDDFVLLLEDLAPAPQGDQVAGCSAAEAEVVVRALARMHAHWWEEDPGPHEWLPYTTVGLDRGRPVQGAFGRAWGRVHHLVEPAAHEAIEAGIEAYVDLLGEVSSGPVTLCHGDFRLDNLFFVDEEPVAFDWQFACRARGAYDLAYFLALDLDSAELATHEDALIEAYREGLAESGVEYSRERLRRDYAVSLILSTAVFAIGAGAPQPSEASRVMHEVGLARLGAAIARTAATGWPPAPHPTRSS